MFTHISMNGLFVLCTLLSAAETLRRKICMWELSLMTSFPSASTRVICAATVVRREAVVPVLLVSRVFLCCHFATSVSADEVIICAQLSQQGKRRRRQHHQSQSLRVRDLSSNHCSLLRPCPPYPLPYAGPACSPDGDQHKSATTCWAASAVWTPGQQREGHRVRAQPGPASSQRWLSQQPWPHLRSSYSPASLTA